jgi:nucleoid-associated protein YejK
VDIKETLAQREKAYGSFTTHAVISQELKEVLQSSPHWRSLSHDKRESLEMICHKMARILNGNAGYIDNWHDICGYSLLIEDNLKERENENENM